MSLQAKRSVRLEDPGHELLDRASALWERYSRVVLGVLGVLVAGGAIAYFAMRARAQAEENAAGQLAEASVTYWSGDYARSLQLARQVAQQYGATHSGRDAHRLIGDNSYWSGDYKTAITEYKTYLDSEKNNVLADAARRSLAAALESDGQLVPAAAEYEKLIGKFDRETSAEFLVAAARCYRLANQPAEAKKRLQRVVDEFGNTTLASFARMELGELNAATGN